MLICNNHISLTSEFAIQEICKPLFVNTSISFFIFARFYDNGAHIVLPSNAKWHQHFWEKDYHKKSKLRLRPGMRLWELEKNFSQAIYDAKKFFNIDNKFEIVERGLDYYDVFGFGSNTGNDQVIDYYFNNIDFLRKFILYFKDKARSLIEQSKKNDNALFIAETKQRFNQKNDFVPKKNKTASLLKPVRRFVINNIGGEISLSQREMTCLLNYLKGRSAHEIGDLLNISTKTAESYLASTKIKLNCSTRKELFDRAYAIGINHLLCHEPEGALHV